MFRALFWCSGPPLGPAPQSKSHENRSLPARAFGAGGEGSIFLGFALGSWSQGGPGTPKKGSEHLIRDLVYTPPGNGCSASKCRPHSDHAELRRAHIRSTSSVSPLPILGGVPKAHTLVMGELPQTLVGSGLLFFLCGADPGLPRSIFRAFFDHSPSIAAREARGNAQGMLAECSENAPGQSGVSVAEEK